MTFFEMKNQKPFQKNCIFEKKNFMTIERTKNEIIVRLSPKVDLVDLQNMLDFLKYKELTANSNANQQDVDELSKIVNKSMMSKISLRQQIK
jgi:hypothetical protein